MFETTIAGSLPKPAWLAEPNKLWAPWRLTGDDLKASNSFAAPKTVAPRSFTAPAVSGGRTRFEIPAHSYAVLQWMM